MTRAMKTKKAARARLGLAAALLATPLLSAPASAAPDLPRSPTGALHLGKKALDLVGRMALELLPSHLVMPEVDRDLLTCPGGSSIQVHVSDAYVDVTPHALTFTPADGALGLDALLDVEGFAHVAITRGYACLGDAVCNVGFSLVGLHPKADLELAITDGKPKAGLGQVGATVAPAGVHLSFDGCVLENFQGGLTDRLAEELLKLAQAPLGNKLREIVPPLIEARLGSMLGTSGQVAGYGFSAAITDLRMTKDGVDTYAAIGVGYEGAVAACLPPEAPPPGPVRNPTGVHDGLSLPDAPTSSVVIGVSTDLLSSALGAAWQAGMMCADDSMIAKLGFDPSKLASLVPGLPEGLAMHFTMSLDQPPVVDVDSHGAIRMRVTGAELLLAMTAPGQPAAGTAVATDFTVGVRPSVDALTGTIYAELTDLTMDRMEIHAGSTGTAYELDPERLAVLLRDVVMPMAGERLRGMPLSPAAFGAAGVYAWLDELSSRDNGVYVGLEAYRPGPLADDTAAPETDLQKAPGRLVRAGMARFQVGGSDDQTPSELLRYEWQLDDGPLMPATFARVINAPVVDAGPHVFRVRAVDLAGKPAPSFAAYRFELDPVPPTLDILEQPAVSHRDTEATIRFRGTDDRSAPNLLSYAYRLEARAPGGEMKLVRAEQPTGLEGGLGRIDVPDLEIGTVYEATVLLYDEAGNVTSKKIGFGVASATGCSASPRGPAGGSASTVLFVLAAIAIVQRRRVKS